MPTARNALAGAKASLTQRAGADQGGMNGVPLHPDVALPDKKQRYAILSTIERRAPDQRVFPAQHDPNAVSPCLLAQVFLWQKGLKKCHGNQCPHFHRN